jgi:Flp pilus assembly protein TadG
VPRLLKGLHRRHLRHEAGQALVVVGLALPLFFAFALVVVDGSRAFVGKRQMQSVADAASLAAARTIQTAGGLAQDSSGTSTCDASCVATVRTAVGTTAGHYAHLNVPSEYPDQALPQCSASVTTNCFIWPYPSDDGTLATRAKVQVKLQQTVSTFFGKVVGVLLLHPGGFDSVNTGARSVAAAKGSTHTYCVDANGNPDPSLDPNSNPPCAGNTVASTHTNAYCVDQSGNPAPGLDPNSNPPCAGTDAFAFAHSTSCSAIKISNNEQNYNVGALWSNGGINTNNLTGGTKNYATKWFYGSSACAPTPNTQPNFVDCGATNPPCNYPPATWVNGTLHSPVASGTWPIPLPNTPAICPFGTYGNGTGGNMSTFIASHRGDISGSDMSVTNGSTTVTSASGGGSGGFIAGDVGRKINIGGSVYQIATVVSSTRITLTTPYSGSTATNVNWYSAGIYCFTSTVTLDTDFMGYMFVTTGTNSNIIKNSGSHTITGSALMAKVMNLANQNAKPMLYATQGGIKFSNPTTLNGDSFLPLGTFDTTGGAVNTGFVEADTIIITQSGTKFIGDGPGPDSGTLVPASDTCPQGYTYNPGPPATCQTPGGTLKTDVTGADLSMDE